MTGFKITLIHGQNHKGSTYHIARMTADKLSDNVEEFFLPRDFSGGCMGCLACLNKGREFCPKASSVGVIFNSMLSSDVIILSSPTYTLEMTAHLKGFLEHIFSAWIPHRPEAAMFKKTAIVVSTAAGAGMNGVTKSMARQMFYMGIAKIYKLPIRVMASSWEGVSGKVKAEIESKIIRVARKIEAGKGRVKPGIKTKLMFMLMRANQRNNDYAPLDKAHWADRNWFGKERPWD